MRTEGQSIAEAGYKLLGGDARADRRTTSPLETLESETFTLSSSIPPTQTLNSKRGESCYTYSIGQIVRQDKPKTKPLHLKREVLGNVVEVRKESVVCAIMLDSGDTEILLPKSYFAVDVRFGDHMAIRIDDSGPIRRPVVRMRTPDESALNKEAEQMDALIGELLS